MSFRCLNGTEHTHESVRESQACWGIGTPAATPVVLPLRATEPQVDYIRDHLGGDPVYAAKLSIKEASDYIKELKRRKFSSTPVPLRTEPPVTYSPVPLPPVYTAPAKPMTDPRLDFVGGMLKVVKAGYYAVQAEEGADVFFMRISAPKNGKYIGAVKVQSVHGTAASKPRLMDALVLWPSGKYTFYGRYWQQTEWREKLIESIMLLVADTFGAARRYSQLIGRCCRCNAALTDERSRHYGIGPECEKYWPHILEMVDASDALSKS